MSLFQNDKQSVELSSKENNKFAIQSAWNRIKHWCSTSNPNETDCILTINGQQIPCLFVCTFKKDLPYFETLVQIKSKSDNKIIGLRRLSCQMTLANSALFTGHVRTTKGYEEHGIGSVLLSLTEELVEKTIALFPEINGAESIRIGIQDNATRSENPKDITHWTQRRMSGVPGYEKVGDIYRKVVKQ